MKLTKDQVTRLKQCLLTIAVKHVRHFITDIVYDFDTIGLLNSTEKIPSKLIFIVRECGTNIEEIGSPTLEYHLSYPENDIRFYSIDIEKMAALDYYETANYTPSVDEDGVLSEGDIVTKVNACDIERAKE
jgi:hypothetical protein